ncbi:hypothetical protein Acor_64080 [Acrocarpospora corrugata]|uniref:Uncharacterized protein n=1 Tax=Acrocarpospora corrugata TaxID=35763 RepID=A0A5M3W7X4_9ACTN|nr:hypothetical protein [Acrocarpospora corrugata]GES04340.1 hypothetical protein Acor_64080 [Acrocarpospora corrugata]
MARFDVIEQRPSRRRWIAGVVIALAVAVPVGGVLLSRETPAPEPTPTPLPALSTFRPTVNMVHPDASGGETRTIKVAFPDGSRARVSYPAELRLAELGLRPYATVLMGTAFRELVAPYQGDAEVVAGGPMIRRLTPAVTLWPRQVGGGGQILLYGFDDWRITLRDQPMPLTFEERLTLAESVHGEVTSDGFLTFRTDPPVKMMEPGRILAGQPVGPQLWIGGGVGPLVVIAPMPDCDGSSRIAPEITRRSGSFGMTCRGDYQVSASGRRDFVARALEGIRIRPE